ncbi:zinc-dependent alcohol dehydrogenase family protein [Paraburkholderia sp. LEh10]|uniref:zinc-dependent alcohol dehydrogenase family protein n=1 Tax=Paraburkholderia sp. LEh10 TaxID=2821353 RepID=UPI001AE1C7FB|nr:zinc-dependent alcohol dehydrogenase family protein [Paraburkholderia sp. LEh10]MBP0590832.1 zinc-dependent alcohol dehydrogenase family protein [Paraburkholderia sp. LEh10]
MQTMRALVAHAVGEPTEVLGLETRQIPQPASGQVRIRVQAVPVHASDLHILRGRYGFAPAFPTVLGLESVGIVDAPGEGVESLTVGQRVITLGVTGTWQEYIVADAARVVAVPDAMSLSTAAQLIANPLTALLLVKHELDVQSGEWLLQTAAGSTVGKLVIQLGKHFGFKTLNVVRRRAAVEEILALGGTAVICTEDEDIRERVAQIVGEEGVTKAIDCVSGQVGADVSRSLAPGGEMLVYGALSTHRQTNADKLTLPLFPRSMIYETKTVRGFWLYRWFTTTPAEKISALLKQTIELVANDTMSVPEGQPFRVEDFAEAVRLAEAPAHGGKPLLLF